MKSHFLRTFLAVLAWGTFGGVPDARTLQFQTTQVTEADLALSPDGKQLVFPILGHLFRTPVGGGAAEQITFGTCYDSDPVFSPDDGRIAFVSDRDGSVGNVFTLELASGRLTQITHESQAGRPIWSLDGKAIVYLRYLPREASSGRPRSFFGAPALCELRKVALDGGKPETIRGPGFLRSIFYLPKGRLAWTVLEQKSAPGSFFPRSTTHLEAIDLKDGKVSRLRSVEGDLGRVTASPGGDGFYCLSSELRFLPLPEGAARRVAALPGGGSPSQFALTADGKSAIVSSRGQIWKIALGNGEREAIPFRAQVKLEVADPARPKWTPSEVGSTVRPRHVLSPRLSPDGRTLIFVAADKLWEQPVDGGSTRRLIEANAWQREPAFSPDGRYLAYVQSERAKRTLRVWDFDSKQTRTLVDLGDNSWALSPDWSRDGKRLLFAKADALFAPLTLMAVNVSDGKSERLASVAGDWSARPQFSADGKSLYYTSRIDGPGTLYRLALQDKAKPEAVTRLARHIHDAAVSPNGKWVAFRRNAELWLAPFDRLPIEEANARRLSPEGGTTFAFTADSSALLYSAGGRVWRHPVDGGPRREVPVRLEWRRPVPPPLLVRRVRVLDFPAGQFGSETSLLLEQGRIRWIGSERGRELPKNVRIIDAAGRYAIPGLFDLHVHSAWANHEIEPDVFLAYGVTSVRDTGGSLDLLGAHAERGAISGDPVPRYFFSGEIFEGAAPLWGDAFLQMDNPEDARNHVRAWKERGAHFIKVYPSLPWPLQRAVAEEARRQGLPVVGHGLGLEEIVKSVTLGYLSLEHDPSSLYEDVRTMLAKAGTRWDPTLAIMGGHTLLLRREPERLNDAKLRAFTPEASLRAAKGGGLFRNLPGEILNARWQERLANLRAAHRGGIALQAGTDSLMTGTFFGASLHWELEHFVESGLTPLEVLRLATAGAAAAVGADDQLGTLAPGKLADLVLLDANPLEQIRHTQTIWRVIKDGWLFDPNGLRPPTDARSGKAGKSTRVFTDP
jgi:imidazolonepropionase-like amidohydrolase/Tol biopolymer transport system component